MNNITELYEISNMNKAQCKKFIGTVIGHKVEEIVTRMYDKKMLLIRFRHEENAYSEMYIERVANGFKYYLKNFTTRELEEVLQ